MNDTTDRILIVVERNKYIIAPSFTENLCSVEYISMLNSANSLACSYSICIIGVSVAVKGLKLTPLFPSQSMTEVLNRLTLVNYIILDNKCQ